MPETIAGRELKEKITVQDMIAADIELTDFFDLGDSPIELNWEKIIQLCNTVIIKGEPVSKQSKVGDVMKIFKESFTKSFL